MYWTFKRMSKISLFLSLLIFIVGCKRSTKESQVSHLSSDNQLLFESIDPKDSGIDFVNELNESAEANYFKYIYLYIGGGVAAGDINNDGLVDLYFTSNLSEDKLYLNKGNLVFEDITLQAGIKAMDDFHTGVTMADVNADGFLDIYVSRGGWKDDNNKFANLLYINNGDLSFSEKAQEYGIADTNRTIQASFFDYDNDNDLDLYVSNTPIGSIRSSLVNLELYHASKKTLKLKGCDKMYENDGLGHFIDVSEKAGLVYDVGYGLNPQVADLNDDGWLDLYVCNDFNAPDLVYINNGNKTFTESGKSIFKHMSFNSMGSDAADINNDGLLDLITLDMNPEDYVRSKTTMAMTPIEKFENMVENGYHYQYMHNMLQLNNGNGTFSEIGNMAGIANTDWSWAVLSADFDLDGHNDVYITNGVYRDVIDRDKNKEIEKHWGLMDKPTGEEMLKYALMLPQQKLTNYFFKNKGDLTFQNTTSMWSNLSPTFSNGATYADLDNDGDLDVVVNNINEPATILNNNAREQNKGQYLKVKFKGPLANSFGLGAKAKLVFNDGASSMRQLMITRGYLSSVSNVLHFGFSNDKEIAKLEIVWGDGKVQVLETVKPNQNITVSYDMAIGRLPEREERPSMFSKIDLKASHNDSYFNDFRIQVLLPHKLSHTGPNITEADVNGDDIVDFYIGGGRNQPGQLFVGAKDDGFEFVSNTDFKTDKAFEDQGVSFLDVDGDGDQDLYVVSGSYEFILNPEMLQDRLYLNDGQGNFTRSKESLPQINSAGSVVVPADYDKDGDIDLFVGGRVIPAKYPLAPKSYLLNNKNGVFEIVTNTVAPKLENIGMVTDASWTDINQDGSLDLIVTGEWMGIEVFINKNGEFDKTEQYQKLSESSGWWNMLLVDDIDNDGDMDIVAGNLGLNTKFHASKEAPFRIYTDDFDSNGTQDVLLAKDYEGREVPVRGKTCMTQQLPYLAKRIKTYEDFASRDLQEIVGKPLGESVHYEVMEFRSGIFFNEGNGVFQFSPFENQIQKSPINSAVYMDFNQDGIKDLLLAGNNFQAEVETTRYDAGTGSLLIGQEEKGTFVLMPNTETGLYLDGDIRDMKAIKTKRNLLLVVTNNNDQHELYKINK